MEIKMTVNMRGIYTYTNNELDLDFADATCFDILTKWNSAHCIMELCIMICMGRIYTMLSDRAKQIYSILLLCCQPFATDYTSGTYLRVCSQLKVMNSKDLDMLTYHHYHSDSISFNLITTCWHHKLHRSH